ncbi:MAG: glycosyltransferase [Verrucomicrobiota bacterium]
MKIVEINSTEAYGGAETIMRAVSRYLQSAGHEVLWLVGRLHELKPSNSRVFKHDSKRNLWARTCLSIADELWEKVGVYKLGRGVCRFIINEIGQPLRTLRHNLGHEDFEYPDTVTAVQRIQPAPEVLHLHGLHSRYFDLRALKKLSEQYLIVVTMHDVWLVTGHCAYPGACIGYTRGCGDCPDLDRFPKVKRDATAYNFRRKKEIYQSSRIHLVTPSRWLMDLVNTSEMSDVFQTQTVIPNGINTDIFSPGDTKEARNRLGLGAFDDVILYCAKNARTNTHKDYDTARKGAEAYARANPERKVILQVIGEESGYEVSSNLVVRFVSLPGDSQSIVDYYRACDVLVHTSLDENFPTVVLEAMACAKAVIVSDTGGMREQVVSLSGDSQPEIDGADYGDRANSNGILVRQKDVEGVSRALDCFLSDFELRNILGKNGRNRVLESYSMEHMGKEYESLFRSISAQEPKKKQTEIYENR